VAAVRGDVKVWAARRRVQANPQTDERSGERVRAERAHSFRSRVAERTWSISDSISLSVLCERRRREHCKNPNAAGHSVRVSARDWGLTV